MNSALKSFDTTENVPLFDEDVDIAEVTADAEETDLFLLVERNPPVQFGLNNQNLDLVYSGHLPSTYGGILRKWIFGINGLAHEMILPSKAFDGGRKCASKELMLKFFR